MNPSLSVVCGQLLVGGFDGLSLPPRFANALRQGHRGGAILFRRNVQSLEQVAALCASLVDASDSNLPLWISIDEEGGRVSRLAPLTLLGLPPMQRLAAYASLSFLQRAGALLGNQLAALGFNLNFAPVLDVNTNPQNPVIGDRSFGSDADTVIRTALVFYRGLSRYVLGCGKHFPGHGDTTVDSHLDLPIIAHSHERLMRIELAPFRAAIQTHIDALMTAHILVPALDADLPATLSRALATDLLRTHLGFEGVLFSDDLEMKAITARFAIEDAAVMAIEAGCDVLLICRDEDAQDRSHEALVHRAERDSTFRTRCSEAFARALEARHRRPPRPLRDPARLIDTFHGEEAQQVSEIVQRIRTNDRP